MRFIGVGIFLLAFVATVNADTTSSPATAIAIFDGQTLSGWHGRPHLDPAKYADSSEADKMKWADEIAAHWKVENGEIVNDGFGAYLVTDKSYGDIELRLKYQTVAAADSGVYLRGTPQVQIWDTTDEKKFDLGANLGSGGLWNNSPGTVGKDPLTKADLPFGQWNDLRVIQTGARTSVYLNDELVVDHAIMENYWNRERPLAARGPIELQTHGGEIRWKDISVRELGNDEANAILARHGGDGFESIFDGSSLTGWTGAVDDYEVADGAIQCRDQRGGNLFTSAVYADFVARLEFQLPPQGNNGLAIRFPGKGNPAYDAFCELQVLDDSHRVYAKLDPRQYHGSAYGMVAAQRGYQREVGQWNFQEVTVVGSQVKVELNGTVILDADLSKVEEFMADSAHPGLPLRDGHFGFAGHNDPVRFRNLSIHRLGDATK